MAASEHGKHGRETARASSFRGRVVSDRVLGGAGTVGAGIMIDHELE
jgi:hypothetical protein